MSRAKEIRSKISSVGRTKKITKAMELVAASKMRKAQDRMLLTRPYAEKALQVISHVANCSPEYKHPFTIVREETKRIGYIIISSDRGLCGSLNHLLFRKVIVDMQKQEEKGIGIDLCLIGNKASTMFKKMGGNIVAQASHLGDKPSVGDLIGIVKLMLDKYKEGSIDALKLCYNKFINTMKQEPQIQQALPLVPSTNDESGKYLWDYIYEPDSITLLDMLMTRYIESQVYQAVVENSACEQAARMVAMKSATDNAGDIIDELQLAYNKARQAIITREISEIVSGADALGG